MPPAAQEPVHGVRVALRVHPRASRARLTWDGAVASVWVTAAAADGTANRAALRAVAAWLQVPPSAVRLVVGHRARSKVVEVSGLTGLPAT